jgi:hypothetical protein
LGLSRMPADHQQVRAQDLVDIRVAQAPEEPQ